MSKPTDALDDMFERNMTPAEVSTCYRGFCKMVLHSIKTGRVDRATRALETLIGDTPVTDFRLTKDDIGDFGLH